MTLYSFLPDEVCDMLTSPMNGEVMFIERFVGSVANYTCNISFELFGSETRTCQSGSVWSGVEPSCERKPLSNACYLRSG